MTLEELKKYREKCVEVQNTIKRDCVYLQNDIAESEHRTEIRFEDFVSRVQKLFDYLPSDEELKKADKFMDYSGIAYRVGGEHVYISLKNMELAYKKYYYTVFISFKGALGLEGLCIYKNGSTWYRETPCRQEQNRKIINGNTDTLYGLIMDLVAEVNKKYNNALIQINKELLDKAEELSEENQHG